MPNEMEHWLDARKAEHPDWFIDKHLTPENLPTKEEIDKREAEYAEAGRKINEERDKRERAVEALTAALAAKGVRLSVGACGCCESPWVTAEIDGKKIVDAMDHCGFDMFEEETDA